MLEKCVILAGFSFCNIIFQTVYLYYSEFYSYLVLLNFKRNKGVIIILNGSNVKNMIYANN